MDCDVIVPPLSPPITGTRFPRLQSSDVSSSEVEKTPPNGCQTGAGPNSSKKVEGKSAMRLATIKTAAMPIIIRILLRLIDRCGMTQSSSSWSLGLEESRNPKCERTTSDTSRKPSFGRTLGRTSLSTGAFGHNSRSTPSEQLVVVPADHNPEHHRSWMASRRDASPPCACHNLRMRSEPCRKHSMFSWEKGKPGPR